MKKPPLRHKAPRKFRRWTACLLLTVCCLSLPALGAEPVDDTSITESAAPAASLEEPVFATEETDQTAGTTPTDSEPTPSPSPSPEPIPDTVTLTFQMGPFGVKTLVVERGTYPSEVPEVPQLPAAQPLGWFDQAGNQVYPASTPAVEDAVYGARWTRKVSDLLNTDEHASYISGYENGMFKPNQSVTRAEAAQMFYSLLRQKDWPQRTFSDVQTAWYTQAVETMAGLGVMNGYSDGSFKPGQAITRAEFVTMAVACDTIEPGEISFSDVPADSWAAPYVATASAKGWISGFKDGTFHPNDKITRAEAVTILNRMLGRVADAEITKKTDVKNFYDVFTDHWAYGNIIEASTSHNFSSSDSGEVWTDYQRDDSAPEKSGWVTDGSTRYYLDAKTKKFLRGEQTIDGKKYLFDTVTGAAFTGFRSQGSWRRYYKDGLLMDDISGLGVVKGPYMIKVYKNSNYLIIFAKDGSGTYNTPVRAMRTSCGYGTPVGTFYTPDKYRWLQMVGDTWAQWCTQIQGNYLFHSVPNWTKSNLDLEVGEYNHLGDTRSMGCIRLNCRDAKWIYDNCVLGTKVVITTSESSGPLSKPAGIQIPSWHTWDPTDPTAYWMCVQNGCH